MARAPIRWEPGFDLSYGAYVYHWPITVLLLAAGADRLPAVLVVLLVAAATGLVAAASWRFVEAPALRLKSVAWVTATPPALHGGVDAVRRVLDPSR